MTFKKIKLQILVTGFLILHSIHVSSQYLRKNMITAQLNGGFLQWEANMGYQYSFARFNKFEFKEKSNQLFVGAEIGKLVMQKGISTVLNEGQFQMHASGMHLCFLLTNIIIKPKKAKGLNQRFKYNYLTFKWVINQFNWVESFSSFDPYDEDDDFNPPDVKWITNPKTKSVDFELHFAKHIMLNSYNRFKVGVYGGFRIGNTTGIEHTRKPNGIETQSKFSLPLNPIILGISLGYQINFGKPPKGIIP